MLRPPFGLCLPCRVRRVIDGDTLDVSLPWSELAWPIRLLDCWAPELREPGGPEARQFAERVLEEAAGELSVYVPPADDPRRPMRMTSLGRVLAHVYVGTERTLSQIMIDAGHARPEKTP